MFTYKHEYGWMLAVNRKIEREREREKDSKLSMEEKQRRKKKVDDQAKTFYVYVK